MKAVILEIRNNFVAAMTDDGCIIQIKNKNYVIGQVIEMKKIVHSHPKLIASAASIAAVIAVSSVSVWAYTTPYSYVSLDVNPSIEYSLNCFDRVLSADAVNEDGEAILKDLDLENKSIEDAIEETIQQIANEGYLSDSELGGIVIAASSDNETKSEEIADSLKEEAETTTAEAGIEAEVETLSIGKERVEEAKALGVTPGKLNLVEKLQASNPDEKIIIEDWLNKPVKSIMKAIKGNKKDEIADDVQDTETEETTAVTECSETEVTSKTTTALITEQQKKQEKTTTENRNQNKNKNAEITTVTTATDVTEGTTVETTTLKKNENSADSKVEKENEQETEKPNKNDSTSNSNGNSDKEKQNNGKSEKKN